MKTEVFENTNIIIGENAQENWDLLDKNENYLWFHLKSFPSCHIILETEEPTKEMIVKAASLCKLHTKYRNIPNLKINYIHSSIIVSLYEMIQRINTFIKYKRV